MPTTKTTMLSYIEGITVRTLTGAKCTSQISRTPVKNNFLCSFGKFNFVVKIADWNAFGIHAPVKEVR